MIQAAFQIFHENNHFIRTKKVTFVKNGVQVNKRTGGQTL